MGFPFRGSKKNSLRSWFLLLLCFSSLLASGFAQPAAPAPTPQQETKPETDKAKAIAARPAEPPPVLQQLNSAIEQLTARGGGQHRIQHHR